MRYALALLLSCIFMTAASAQQASAPEPVLRVKVDPPRVVVGQSAVLQVDVLAPNYMTKPPVLPDFQVRNAVTRAGSTINMSEQRDGMTYAGVRFEFLIYPQEPGSYAIAGQKIAITYAAEPPATREVELSVPRIAFDAFIPDGARTLDPFISASALQVRQDVQKSSESPKVGDAVTRTVTVEAEGTPSMLLPPAAFAAVDGMRIYPAQPDLQDSFDRRTDRLSSTRIDRVTYMLERPGDFSLPAVEVAWWNVREQRLERARADAIVLRVADNPALKTEALPERSALPSLRSILISVADHWPAILLAIAALLGLSLIVPRSVRAICAWNRQRRERYLASEACAFANFRAVARRRDPRQTYSALFSWLLRFEPAGPAHTIATLKAAACDPHLDSQIEGLERHLFAADAGQSDGWSARPLVKNLGRVRERLLSKREPDDEQIPLNLNPRLSSELAYRGGRAVAR